MLQDNKINKFNKLTETYNIDISKKNKNNTDSKFKVFDQKFAKSSTGNVGKVELYSPEIRKKSGDKFFSSSGITNMSNMSLADKIKNQNFNKKINSNINLIPIKTTTTASILNEINNFNTSNSIIFNTDKDDNDLNYDINNNDNILNTNNTHNINYNNDRINTNNSNNNNNYLTTSLSKFADQNMKISHFKSKSTSNSCIPPIKSLNSMNSINSYKSFKPIKTFKSSKSNIKIVDTENSIMNKNEM